MPTAPSASASMYAIQGNKPPRSLERGADARVERTRHVGAARRPPSPSRRRARPKGFSQRFSQRLVVRLTV